MILTFLHYIFVAVFVLFFFGFCIFIHELGHFLAAKWRKMHIVAFSIGFKKIWGFRRNGVEYRIGCLPFGGYVDIPQLEANSEVKDKFGHLLPPITPINRIIVAFAGPLFNILFGLVLGTFLWIHGVPEPTPRMKTIEVAEVIKDSPEYNAGLRTGDKIVKINGKKFYASWSKIFQEIIFTTDKVKLGLQQEDSRIKNIEYTPQLNKITPEGKALAEEGLPYPFFSPAIPIIINVEKNSTAAKAGFKNGDKIIQINNHKPLDFMNLLHYIATSNGEKLTFKILRKNKAIVLKDITPTAYNKSFEYYKIGVRDKVIDNKLYIDSIEKNSAADKVGLKKGDLFISVKNIPVNEQAALRKIINENKANPLNFVIERNGKRITKIITPVFSKQKLYYLSGIAVVFYNHINPVEQFVNVIMMSYNSLKGIFSKNSNIKAKHLSGPVGIISLIGKVVYMGMFIQALNIVTIITFCLALMNLLPLPILDGGHIFISIIEIIIRRHLPAKIMQPICMFFAFLLIALMIFATYNDVNRLVNFKKLFTFGQQETKEKSPLKN